MKYVISLSSSSISFIFALGTTAAATVGHRIYVVTSFFFLLLIISIDEKGLNDSTIVREAEQGKISQSVAPAVYSLSDLPDC